MEREGISRKDLAMALKEVYYKRGQEFISGLHFIVKNPAYDMEKFSQEMYESEPNYFMESCGESQKYIRDEKETNKYTDKNGNVYSNSTEWLLNYSRRSELRVTGSFFTKIPLASCSDEEEICLWEDCSAATFILEKYFNVKDECGDIYNVALGKEWLFWSDGHVQEHLVLQCEEEENEEP